MRFRGRRGVSAEAGIALGPILFIVAILGILAAAIAASSGSFSGNNRNEAARTNASALIQIGNLLKVGFSRLIGSGIEFDSIIIDPNSTVNDTDLFSPSGGSVNVPMHTLANDPAIDIWHYPLAALPQMGTSATDRIALLKINKALCLQINIKANAISTDADDSALVADIGDVTAGTLTGVAAWPTPLISKEMGCLKNTNVTTAGYFYFQVLGVR